MKKVFAIILILTVCMSLACPVFAAQEDFVPSITYKGEPEIIPVKDKNGEDAIGIIIGEQGEEDPHSFVYADCLVITPVSEVDTSEEIPDEAAALLKEVYEGLVSGDMKLPYEEVAGYTGQEMVILELIDMTWLCDTPNAEINHPDMMENEGMVFQTTFDLGVGEFTKVVIMVYKDGEWKPIEKVVNNGDGTVTCDFSYLCPVVFCVSENYTDIPPQTGDTSNVWIWFVVMLAALAGIVTVAVVGLRKKKR